MKSVYGRLSCLLATIAVAMSVALAPAALAHAQDNCFGLNADDCALAKAGSSPDAYSKLTAFSMAYSSTVTGSGGGRGNGTFTVTGTGSYSTDKPFDITAAGTETPDQNTTLQQAMTIVSQTNDKPARTTHYEVRIVGGMLYFLTGIGKWYSAQLSTNGESNPLLGSIGDPNQYVKTLRQAFQILASEGIVKAERGPDITIDNQQIAAFVFHFDIVKALSAPDPSLMLKFIGSRVPGLTSSSPEKVKAQIPQLQALFKNTQFTMTRYIGTSDKLPHGVAVDITANIDPKDAAPFMPTPDPAGTPPADSNQPLVYSSHFEFKISGIGTKVEVQAPPDAKPLPVIPAAKTPTPAS